MFLSESERRRSREEREAAIEQASYRREILHVAPIFWLQIPSDTPIDHLLNPLDPNEIVRRVDAQNNRFTFEPRKLVLGKTKESVSVLPSECWYLKERVLVNGMELPLRCHLSAPNIHPGSSGHQTYEFYNDSSEPIEVAVTDLEVIAWVLKLTGPTLSLSGRFRHQSLDENPYPDFRNAHQLKDL